MSYTSDEKSPRKDDLNAVVSAVISDNKMKPELNDETREALIERLGRKAEDEAIAPSEDIEFLFDKIATITEQECLDTLTWAEKEYEDDWNFPVATKERIEKLKGGPENFDDYDDYLFALKTEAVLLKYSSPYPEVRAITDPYDDPTLPVETIRAYFLGLAWSCIGMYINNFFMPRYPSVSLSAPVIQLLMYPCGVALATILPDWGVTIRGVRHTLNPGPWSYKEQMFATICFNVAVVTPYVYWNIMAQKLPMYYNVSWVTYGYQIMLTLSNQFMGFGFAGLMRRFVIYPARAIFPTHLPTLALNRALTRPERKQNINGWTISSYYFFLISFGAMFLYFWLPDYLMQCLSTFNWMTWIAPNNFNLATITGSSSGLGYNPISTFDWNVMSYVINPLAVPFWSAIQQFAGTFIAGFAIMAVFYTNTKWSAYMPINSSAVFDNTGSHYNVSKVLTSEGKLDLDGYQNYSPAFYTAGNLIVYGAFFLLYPLNFIYCYGNQWTMIKRSLQEVWTAIRTRKRGTFEGYQEPHCVMMSKYPEVPDWCYFIVLLISLVFAIIIVEVWKGVDTPVWIIFVILGINLVFLLPMLIMQATTGVSEGLNVVIELICGYIFPGNPQALMFVKAFGYQIDGQASSYVSDQKMAHYAKIPPRAIFRGQLLSSFIVCFVSVAVTNWLIANIDGICTSDQPQKFTCVADVQIYFSASVMWGLIGPKRVFGDFYPVLKWCFFIGFVIGTVWIFIEKAGPRIVAHSRRTMSESSFNTINKILYKPFGLLKNFQPVVFCNGWLQWAPYNLSFQVSAMYLSFFFMYYLKRRYTAWWEKYTYVLSAGLTAGVAFSAIIIFFAVQYHEKDVNWGGNSIMYDGLDGAGLPLLDLPEKGYFGPDPGNYP